MFVRPPMNEKKTGKCFQFLLLVLLLFGFSVSDCRDRRTAISVAMIFNPNFVSSWLSAFRLATMRFELVEQLYFSEVSKSWSLFLSKARLCVFLISFPHWLLCHHLVLNPVHFASSGGLVEDQKISRYAKIQPDVFFLSFFFTHSCVMSWMCCIPSIPSSFNLPSDSERWSTLSPETGKTAP